MTWNGAGSLGFIEVSCNHSIGTIIFLSSKSMSVHEASVLSVLEVNFHRRYLFPNSAGRQERASSRIREHCNRSIPTRQTSNIAAMADRTQDPQVPTGGQLGNDAETTPAPKKPKHEFPKSQVGKLWEEFGNPEEPINLMPGGTYNSAGGKPREPTYWDAVKSVFAGDPNNPNSVSLTQVHKAPCARDALLVGIGVGFGTGGLSAVLGGKWLRHKRHCFLY